MTWSRTLFVPLVLAALAPPAPAGIFSRKPKPNPVERVPELLIQLKTSTDEAQRTAAAEELRQYDPKSYPDLIPGLIDALGRDASPAVRSEAAASLGRLRPISQQAGYALEKAQNNDSTVRVRLAARQALLQYHIVGYRAGKTQDAPATGGSPNATAAAPGSPATPRPIGQPTARSGNPGRETVEPPLAMPAVRRPSDGPPPTQLIPTNPGLQPVPASPGDPQAGTPPKSLPTNPQDGPALPPSG
jgi:HEAT repeats